MHGLHIILSEALYRHYAAIAPHHNCGMYLWNPINFMAYESAYFIE